jgi:hypothetical protein
MHRAAPFNHGKIWYSQMLDCGTKSRPTAFVFLDGIARKGTEELKPFRWIT